MFGLDFVDFGLGYRIWRRFGGEVVLKVLMFEEGRMVSGNWITVPLIPEVEDEDVRVKVLLSWVRVRRFGWGLNVRVILGWVRAHRFGWGLRVSVLLGWVKVHRFSWVKVECLKILVELQPEIWGLRCFREWLGLWDGGTKAKDDGDLEREESIKVRGREGVERVRVEREYKRGKMKWKYEKGV